MTTTVQPVTATERKVAEMLLENTGASLLDSGGAYGRAWQWTRAKYGLDGGLPNSEWDGFPKPTTAPDGDEIERVALAMRDEPEGYISEYGDIEVRTFHWLTRRLAFAPELHAKFERWQRVTNLGKDRYDKDWGLPLVDRFMEQLDARSGVSGGPYGEGKPDWVNTYNGECALDRTLQFLVFHVRNDGFLPEGSYVILQIHGGADVRGGYTDPVLFEADTENVYDFDRVEVWCSGAEVLPEGVPAGQVTMDAEVVEPKPTGHLWDNSYDGNHLRLTRKDDEWLDGMYPGKVEHILATPYSENHIEELREKGVQIEYEWEVDGKVMRPAVFAEADIATIDDDKHWHCPYDGSELVVSGQMVG